MSNEELDRLAALIVAEIQRVAKVPPVQDPAERKPTWLPVPVRPEPSATPGEPPVWAAAAQRLGDVAPIRVSESSRYRADDASAANIRAAAAGRAPAREGKPEVHSPRAHSPRARGGIIEVPIGVSKRHLHLSTADAATLLGSGPLTVHRSLSQPGQFAAEQRVHAVGPKGRIDGIRVVGPARGATQLELAFSDAAFLGIAPPVANSGKLDRSVGEVTLEGPNGRLALTRGVIVAARHLHLSPEDGARWYLRDGDLVTVKCGSGPRAATWHGVLVRCSTGHATELHLDEDEARAAGVAQGDVARVVAHASAAAGRRVLVTEREVLRLAQQGEPLPAGALLTPGARDRARTLGLAIG